MDVGGMLEAEIRHQAQLHLMRARKDLALLGRHVSTPLTTQMQSRADMLRFYFDSLDLEPPGDVQRFASTPLPPPPERAPSKRPSLLGYLNEPNSNEPSPKA